jgi:hypothetical protein
MAKPVLRHRLRLTAQGARAGEGMSEDSLIEALLERLEARQKNLAKGID